MESGAPSIIQGRYRLVRPLGEGGLATTFLSDDLVMDRQVALKLLSEASIERSEILRHEFLTLRNLMHPHLVRVYDFGTFKDQGRPRCFYTARLVEGVPLGQYAQGKTWQDVEPVFIELLEALRFLHALRLVHGDIHGDNILVERSGRATLVDLSCSRSFGSSGVVCGRPGTMAPEVAEAGSVDGRADLYSVGVTIEALGSRLRTGLPAAVASLCRRLCEGAPERRPSDAGEVLEALGVDLAALVKVPIGRPSAILGRDAELQVFREVLDAVEAGKSGPRALVVLGPDGIGRTRLLMEMKWEAQQRLSVVEGTSNHPCPLASMFARAHGRPSTDADLETLLGWQDELVAGHRGPSAMFLDDVHRLDETQASLLSAVLRSMPKGGALLFVCASRSIEVVESEALRHLSLGPLDKTALTSMVGDAASGEFLAEIVRATSGLPGLVMAVVDQLRDGALSGEDWARVLHPKPRVVEERFRALDDSERSALGMLAILALLRDEISDRTAADLGISDATLWRLIQEGWVLREGSSIRLARTLEARVVVEALGDGERRSANRELMAWVSSRVGETRGEDDEERALTLEAELITLMAESGEVEGAIAKFGEVSERCLRAPAPFLGALDAILRRKQPPALLLRAVELDERMGHPRRALRRIEDLLDSGDRDHVDRRGHLMAASCLLKLGDAKGALAALGRLSGGDAAEEVAGSVDDLRARALIKLGRYGEALDVVERALGRDADSRATVDLLLDMGLAASYLGDVQRAREGFARARALVDEAGDAHLRVRFLAYEALNEFRSGNLNDAARGFEGALLVAQEQGLNDQVAHAALNLGVAYHQMGDLGRALSSYERALRLAVAMGAVSAEATLRHNIATLYFDVGLLQRSKASLARAEASAREAGVELVAAEGLSLRGQIALAEGDVPLAKELPSTARERFHALSGARREVAETELHLAKVELERGEVSGAAKWAERSLRELRSLGVIDLQARALIFCGQLALAREVLDEATHRFEEARELARRGQSRLVEAAANRFLVAVYARRGSDFLARQRRLQARELLETVASSLPTEWRDAFWESQGPDVRAGGSPRGEAPSHREPRLRRLLELTTSLSASLDVDKVLERTMDAAIEVTGAERGFVILARAEPGGEGRGGGPGSDELRVAVARNIDRERLGRSSLKFSRSIALEVIRTGEPLVTSDALVDERFQSQRSIHAMKLRSIVCVPIRDAASVIGALYVDNRFQRGRFSEEDTDLLLAFANHVAVALINARLHGELARKTMELAERSGELEAQKAKVEGLLAEKSERLDEVQRQLSATQEVLEHRYDYGTIIGRSPAMSAVLRQLDRIIPTSTTVLIRGESGTGKELCARAVHFNGPRRRGPFVSINCGAIPETLLESELFGHVRGAFTDAHDDKGGLLRAAQGGTLFLDEIGEMPPAMQVKLLRAIEERKVRPLGGTRPVSIDIRLICATHRDLLDEVGRGTFRQDLYYRLAVVEVVLPPLRERPGDIPPLAEHLMERIASELGVRRPGLSAKALRTMVAYHWPGNVRQLENVLTKAILLATGRTLHTRDLELPSHGRATPQTEPSVHVPTSREAYQRREAQEIAELLATYRWNVTKTALHLGLSRTTLYNKMRRYGLVKSQLDGP